MVADMDGFDSLGDIIKSLSENEEVMKAIGSIKESMGNEAEAVGKNTDIREAVIPAVKNAERLGKDTENRNRLLSALRPYVNNRRREMIDGIMSLSRITGMMDLIGRKGE